MTVRERPALSLGSAMAPGTCGELFQGVVDGEPCLVSCPIDRWAAATVELDPNQRDWRIYARRWKVLKAVSVAAERLGIRVGGRIRLESNLPLAKGYGSSTADIGAAVEALCRAARVELPAEELSRLAVSVEPTDSSLLAGLALLAHRSGHRIELLGPPPPIEVLVLDADTPVDTLAFNRRDPRELFAADADAQAEAYDVLAQAIAEADLAGVGWAATRSAEIHQRKFPKPGFERLLTMVDDLGALGINVAHSGSLIGVLFDRSKLDHLRVMQVIHRERLPLRLIGWQRLVPGGIRAVHHARSIGHG